MWRSDFSHKEILDKAINRERIYPDEAISLFEMPDILALGNSAFELARRNSSDYIVTYIIDRNINYSNICISRCRFCAFWRDKEDHDAYLLTFEDISEKIKETLSLGGRQILMQGGLHPDLKIDFYETLLRYIKSNYDIHIHAFSPPEILHIAKISGISLKEVLIRLKDAGLGSIPGGGAEILVDKIRESISPNKCSANEWLMVMEIAHQMGIRSTATMMFGHIESIRDRVTHLIRLRELQDRTGGFTAFIPWSFQPQNTAIGGDPSTGLDYLRTLSVSRIVLDNFDNIQVSWVTQGPKIAQIALLFGANDMGSTMIEENVVRAAGVSYRISEEDIRRLIKEMGFSPHRRDVFYHLISDI
ncbi:MAG: dehypoxanthine futalosine cyclase [Nitrospinae bacterium]|nr:dehypoxanthine futalosine cyclase [Nitrospinota bacterium]